MDISQIPDHEMTDDLAQICREIETARRMIWLHEAQLKAIRKQLEMNEATQAVIVAEQARRAAQKEASHELCNA